MEIKTILLAIAIGVNIFLSMYGNKSFKMDIIKSVFIIISLSVALILTTDLTEKEIAVKCLKGKNPYEQQINKIYKGDSLIKTDTLYIKKIK